MTLCPYAKTYSVRKDVTFSHLLIVNQHLSLSLSPSLPLGGEAGPSF